MSKFTFIEETSLHDITDNLKFNVYDGLDVVDEEHLKKFSEDFIKKLSEAEIRTDTTTVKFNVPENVEFSGNASWIYELFTGEGEKTLNDIETVSSVFIETLQEHGLNGFMTVILNALNIGREVTVWATTAVFNGQISCSDFIALDDTESERWGCYLNFDDEPYDDDEVNEYIIDNIMDGFDELPYDQDENEEDYNRLYDIAYEFFS